jgi:glutathione S-transferase
VKLYYSPGGCSLSPHIVLRELGLPFEIERVDLKTGTTASGARYATINPKGYVPALQLDDGNVLTETAVVLQYLADRKPESGLAPAPGTLERYRLQEWLNYVASELHKSLGSLFNRSTPAEWKESVKKALAPKLELVAHHLDGREHLLGSAFTVADSYLWVVLSWTKVAGVDLRPWPVLLAYLKRVGGRPATRAALGAEGLV